eukprot:10810647-Heterocapsa_arctica.AAC.1
MEKGMPGMRRTKEDREGGKCPHAFGQQPSEEGQASHPGHHEWECLRRPSGNTRQHQVGAVHSSRPPGINQEGK